MVGARLGVGMDRHRARPQLLRADAGEIDRGLAVHSRGLRGVRIERPGGHDAHAVVLPGGRGVVGVGHREAPADRGTLAPRRSARQSRRLRHHAMRGAR